MVHINAGIAGLVGAYVIGKRIGYGKEAMAPHSLTMTMIGASLLWVGWFGFNVGSNLEATGTAALVFVNTLVATAAAALSWMFVEWMFKGKPSHAGCRFRCAVAGLVAITPACGFVGPMGAIAIGLIAGVVCLWGVSGLKKLLGCGRFARRVRRARRGRYYRCAAAPACLPRLRWAALGIYDYVANKASPDYSIMGQVMIQATGVVTTIVWSAWWRSSLTRSSTWSSVCACRKKRSAKAWT